MADSSRIPRTRSSNKQLLGLFAACSNPVYVLDERRKLVYCNEACADWLGVTVKELVGRRCDYHSGDVPTDEVTAALSPPPEVFGGQFVASQLTHCQASGHVSRRHVHFFPLTAGRECLGVVALLADTDGVPLGTQQVAQTDSADLHDRLRIQIHRVRRQYRVDRLVGESPPIRRVRAQVRLAVESRARVSIVGPTGSGREHVARSIHCGRDPESAGPLMPLSSHALDAELLQTTLQAFMARCREAAALDSATVLFLDVDQLTPSCQAELLSFVSLPTFDLRTIVTARSSLSALSVEGEFDDRLALALSTLEIELPPLSSRRSDIPLLAQHLLEGHNADGDKQLSGFNAAALDKLGALPWTRDTDELAEVVEEAWRTAEGPWITESCLPKAVEMTTSAAAFPKPDEQVVPLDDFLLEVERELIERAMQRAKGNKAQAARLLGIHRARLLRRLAQLEESSRRSSPSPAETSEPSA